MRKEPREDDRAEVESRRLTLITQLNVLDTLHGSIGVSPPESPAAQIHAAANNAAAFDDLDDDEATEPRDTFSAQSGSIPSMAAAADFSLPLPEDRLIVLPSNCGPRHATHRAEELMLRVSQAENCLQALRDAIADKSFQYSDVIRVASRKSVNTRARATIAKLNYKIAFHARVYSRCR